MIKHFCDCCGEEMKTWYKVRTYAEDGLSRCGCEGLTETFAHNMANIMVPEKIYCKACVDRALNVLKPKMEESE